MNTNSKTPSASYTEQVHLVNSADLNGSKRLFGGTLLSWIDVVAGITARRHTGKNAITAAIDNLNFIKPAFANDVIVICGKVTYIGNTSLEVCVKSYIENPDCSRELMNIAYVVMVSLGDDGKPCPVPPLRLETDSEIAEFEMGKKRRELRKLRRSENF